MSRDYTKEIEKYKLLIGQSAISDCGKIYNFLDLLRDGCEGANGILYKVSDENDNFLALKVLNTTDEEKEARFKNEYNFQHDVDNSYIVKAFDTGRVKITKGGKSKLFYTMKIYDCNYRNLIDSSKKEYVKNPYKKIKFILDLCEGLKEMHSHEVWHRDLKPENILFDKKNKKVLIADLGIAHFKTNNLTGDDEQMGNFDYHAPEQKKNGNKIYGPFTDIYSLGLIINETFTSVIPSGENYKKIQDFYKPFAFLDDIVSKMILQDYQKRIHDIDIVIYDIKNGLNAIAFSKKKVSTKIQNELESNGILVKKATKGHIQEDFVIVNGFVDDFKTKPEINKKNYLKNIDFNYHMNVSYNLDTKVFNSYVTYNIYSIIYHYFIYETSSKEFLGSTKNPLLIDRLTRYFEDYDCLSTFKHYKREAIKLFSSLKEYHSRELFDRIENMIKESKENLLDAPLFWLFAHLQQNDFWKVYIDKFPNADVSDFVIFNSKRFSNKIENKNLYIENYYEKKFVEFLDAFKKYFNSVEMIDENHCRLSSSDSRKLIDYFDSNFEDDGSVDCGDLIDFRDGIEDHSTGSILEINSYQYNLVLNFFANFEA